MIASSTKICRRDDRDRVVKVIDFKPDVPCGIKFRQGHWILSYE
jgi:hypothetical protein